VGAIIVLGFLLLVIFAAVVAPYDPFDQDFANTLGAPSFAHPFGTDQYGRDVLSRVMFGSRTALLSILVADGLALFVGCALGLIAGFFGKWVDATIMRVVDVL